MGAWSAKGRVAPIGVGGQHHIRVEKGFVSIAENVLSVLRQLGQYIKREGS